MSVNLSLRERAGCQARVRALGIGYSYVPITVRPHLLDSSRRLPKGEVENPQLQPGTSSFP
jgi:hypothetical protein